MNWSVQAIHIEGRAPIRVSVACFNFSLAEVWSANICLTIASLANNSAVAAVKSMRWINTVLLTCYRRYEWLQSNNPIIISRSLMWKKHASGRHSFENFYEPGSWFTCPGTQNSLRPQEPCMWFIKAGLENNDLFFTLFTRCWTFYEPFQTILTVGF